MRVVLYGVLSVHNFYLELRNMQHKNKTVHKDLSIISGLLIQYKRMLECRQKLG